MAQTQQHAYGFGVNVDLGYPDAVEQTKTALKEQGFGILCEIDVKQVMKEKRGIDFRPYVILGACNPPLAEKALTAEIDMGVLLPCNVIVYATEAGSRIEAMDPVAVLSMVQNPAIEPVAHEVKQRLSQALKRVEAMSNKGQ